jgi:flagellar hook-associated protein 3 FlgL
MMVESSIKDMSDSLSKYNDLMQKSSDGKKFHVASDDPTNAVSALSIRSTLQKQEAYIDTANTTKLWMDATDSAVVSMQGIANRAINMAIEGLSDTMGADQRVAISHELDTMITQAIGVGNTKHLGNYIFAGFQTNTKPFDLVKGTYPVPPGTPDTVSYSGDDGAIQRNIGPQHSLTVNLTGSIFNGTGHDIFTALIQVRDALSKNDREGTQYGLKNLQNVADNLNNQRVEYGGKERELQTNIDRMETTKIQLRSLLSDKEDANMTEAISYLKQQETIYQTVLNVSNRAMSLSNLFERM